MSNEKKYIITEKELCSLLITKAEVELMQTWDCYPECFDEGISLLDDEEEFTAGLIPNLSKYEEYKGEQ